MTPVDILQKLKSNKSFSTEELCEMLNSVEEFNIRTDYMESIKLKCEKLIIDMISRKPFEKED